MRSILIILILCLNLCLAASTYAANYGIIKILAEIAIPAFDGDITIDGSTTENWWRATVTSDAAVNANSSSNVLIVPTGGIGNTEALLITYSVAADESIIIGTQLDQRKLPVDLGATYNELTFYVNRGSDYIFDNFFVSIANGAFTSNNFIARVSDFLNPKQVSGNYTQVVIPFSDFRPAQLTGDIPNFADLLANAFQLQFIVNGDGPGTTNGQVMVDDIVFKNDAQAAAVTTYNPAESFDMESYGSYWYTAVSLNQSSVALTVNMINGATTAMDQAKVMAIDYNITNTLGRNDYAVIGRSFWTPETSVALTPYGEVSFYIKATTAELSNLYFSLTNAKILPLDTQPTDKIGTINYQIRVGDYVVSAPDASGFVRVNVPFSAFKPAYYNGSTIPDFAQIIASVNAVQFQLNKTGSGEILVDNIMFTPDTTAPSLTAITPTQIKLTATDIGVMTPQSLAIRKASASAPQVELRPTINGLLITIPVVDNGLIVIPKNTTPNIWLEMSSTTNKIYMSATGIKIENNRISGVVRFPVGMRYGTGNIFVDAGSISDLAGNKAVAGKVAVAVVVYTGDLMQPALSNFMTSWDPVGRRVPVDQPLVVHVFVSDPSGIDMGSTPVLSYIDQSKTVRSIDLKYAVRISSRDAFFQFDTPRFGTTANFGMATFNVSGIKDIYLNELISKFTFTIVKYDPMNRMAVSKIYINDKDVVTSDVVESQIRKARVVFSDDVDMTSFNVKICNVDNSVISESGIQAFTITGNGLVGSVTMNIATADHTFVSPVNLAPGNYKLVIEGYDISTTSVTAVVNFTVTDTLLTGLLSAPNPFNPNQRVAHIGYYLSEAANVQFKIFSISGEFIKGFKVEKGQPGGQPGYNELVWDGHNKWDEIVANGVYLGYMQVDTGAKKSKAKVKIAVTK